MDNSFDSQISPEVCPTAAEVVGSTLDAANEILDGLDPVEAIIALVVLQLFVEAHKAVIQLCAAPDEGLVFGIGRVEGGNARRLVVAEYLFVAVVGHPAGCQS